MSKKRRIFVSRPDLPNTALQLLSGHELDIWNKEENIPQDIFIKRIAGKDALFIGSSNIINVESLNAAGSQLKVIATMSAGLDHIDVNECKKRGIKLGYTGVVLNDAVAELAIGLILTSTRRLYEARVAMTNGSWKPWVRWDWMNGFGLKNTVIGIFGMGSIGSEIAKRLIPFKPSKILYTSRTPKKLAGYDPEKVELDCLLKESDVVVVSVILNDETRSILNEDKLNLMKKTAYLVNVSRGAIIDHAALVQALKYKKIAGAALDVMVPEPLPKDHELYSLDNCVLLPHIGSAETATRNEMAELTSKNILAGLENTDLPMEAP